MSQGLPWDLLLYKIFPLAFDTARQGNALRLVCKRVAEMITKVGFWKAWIARREREICAQYCGAEAQVKQILQDWSANQLLKTYLIQLSKNYGYDTYYKYHSPIPYLHFLVDAEFIDKRLPENLIYCDENLKYTLFVYEMSAGGKSIRERIPLVKFDLKTDAAERA
jgi:hypothetical protein